MTEDEFKFYYEHYYVQTRYIPNMAKKLSLGDRELYQDLKQSALLILWSLNPRKASRNVDAWIRQAIKFAMYRELKVQAPEKYLRLDMLLAKGGNIEDTEDGPRLRVPDYPGVEVIEQEEEEESKEPEDAEDL